MLNKHFAPLAFGSSHFYVYASWVFLQPSLVKTIFSAIASIFFHQLQLLGALFQGENSSYSDQLHSDSKIPYSICSDFIIRKTKESPPHQLHDHSTTKQPPLQTTLSAQSFPTPSRLPASGLVANPPPFEQ